MPFLDGTKHVHGICNNRQNWSSYHSLVSLRLSCVICLKLKAIVIELLSVGSVVASDAVRSKPELFKLSYCPEVVFIEPREQPQ